MEYVINNGFVDHWPTTKKTKFWEDAASFIFTNCNAPLRTSKFMTIVDRQGVTKCYRSEQTVHSLLSTTTVVDTIITYNFRRGVSSKDYEAQRKFSISFCLLEAL